MAQEESQNVPTLESQIISKLEAARHSLKHSVCFSGRCTGCSLPLGKRSLRLRAARGWLDSKHKSAWPHMALAGGLAEVGSLAHVDRTGVPLQYACIRRSFCKSKISGGRHFNVLYKLLLVRAVFQPSSNIIRNY